VCEKDSYTLRMNTHHTNRHTHTHLGARGGSTLLLLSLMGSLDSFWRSCCAVPVCCCCCAYLQNTHTHNAHVYFNWTHTLYTHACRFICTRTHTLHTHIHKHTHTQLLYLDSSRCPMSRLVWGANSIHRIRIFMGEVDSGSEGCLFLWVGRWVV
jgi:hypothetical protein